LRGRVMGTFIVCGIALFFIILWAVKIAVKEALYEFKEDIIKEFKLREINKEE
jgi:hypothetical protein